MTPESRATFGGRLSAVLAAAGSAIGLGNVWRFPYIAGNNGGGAFVIVYILAIILLGLPILIAEFSVGSSTRKNIVGAYRQLSRRWSVIGYLGIISALCILGFYFVVSGWTTEYMVHSITADISHYTTAEEYAGIFSAFIENTWRPLLYTWIFVLATHFIIVLGVQKGIERSAQILMPILFVILIILAIHSILLPNGAEGLKFLFKPDFSKVNTEMILLALGQAFFSLSIGLGSMVTYASYFRPDTNIRQTALHVTILDTAVAILAGIIIFPAVFSAGIEPTSGPSLVFITLPSIFNGMTWGMMWSTIFFALLVVAALTSTISIHEVVTAYINEEWHWSRRASAWTTTIATGILATFASLSLGALNSYRIFGLSFFDLLDFMTANVLLPLGGMLTSIFVGWFADKHLLRGRIDNGSRSSALIARCILLLLRYICPALLMLVFLDNLGWLEWLF